ncbi:hypothetical protein GCM10025778_35360 [Paeniglutamicibacter antarcticus]|uniref:Uncharacterized protein n=1 Tax=Paeniglutamicibacter antarcticus TaxID=494023 RepID=A0ABP9TTI6_9MICC
MPADGAPPGANESGRDVNVGASIRRPVKDLGNLLSTPKSCTFILPLRIRGLVKISFSSWREASPSELDLVLLELVFVHEFTDQLMDVSSVDTYQVVGIDQ